MAALASDNFDRADNADLGANWTPVNTEQPLKILSNQAQNTNDSNDAAEYYGAVTWPNDQYSQAAITSGSYSFAGDGIGVMVRAATSATTYYRCVMNRNATNTVEVGKKVAGTYTSLGNRNATYAAGQVLYVEARGTTLKVFYNGSQLGSNVTDASITSGRTGLVYSSEGAGLTSQWDTWEGGDFSEPEHQTRRNEIRQLLAQ